VVWREARDKAEEGDMADRSEIPGKGDAMKRSGTRARITAMIVVGVLAAATSAGGRGWLSSYDQAAALARKTDKLILADFTGSDWCPACMMLKKEVFTTEQFKAWASKNAVLLELDFPRTKPQSAATKAHNERLREKYGVHSFPTILFLDPDGRKVGEMGYVPGGPGPWCDEAQGIVDRYRKSSRVALSAGMTAARAEAAKLDRPLLVVVSAGADDAARIREGLFRHPPFAGLVNSRMIAAHLELGKKAQTERFDRLKKDLKIDEKSRFVLIDVKKRTVLYEAPHAVRKQALLAGLSKALPRIPYDGGWLTDFTKAGNIAVQEGRPMMLNFTGSDRGGWCEKLEKEILSTEQFKDWAAGNLILVELDFPRRNSQPANVKSQNLRIAQQHGIRGIPTIVILDPAGKKIAEMGYRPGGPEPFIRKLEAITRRASE